MARRRYVYGWIVAGLLVALLFTTGCVEQEAPPEPSGDGGTETTFTREEVARHSTAQDCWIIVHGKVYNVTDIPCHGGSIESTILQSCGTDITVLWDEKPGTGKPHSESAQSILDPHYLGVVAETD
jgi:cytochrome b involved in lipid metabolism